MAALMDWRDVTRTDRIIVQMVSPTNVDAVVGELEGVDLTGSTITAGYYTDTRTSAKIRVVDGNWIRGTHLRIIHAVPEWNYAHELGTYLVTNDDAEQVNGAWVTTLTCQSLLFGLSTDKLVRPWAIAANAMMLTAAAQCVQRAGYKYDFGGAADARIKSTKVIATGTDRLSALFALAKLANDRLDVTAHGYVTLRKYVPPSQRVPIYRIDLRDPRGVALDGLSRSSDYLEMPSVVGVCYRYNDTVGGKSVQREINASARLSANSPHSYAARGYTITDFHELSDMSPKTAARAQQLAEQYLANDSTELVEWELSTIYLPIWQGDVVELVVYDGEKAYQGVRRCMVKSLEIRLSDLTMQLTLKETASGDDE